MLIYAFEGPFELSVSESLADAEGEFEAIDVEDDEFVFFAEDGTVIKPSVRAGRVVLTPLPENIPMTCASGFGLTSRTPAWRWTRLSPKIRRAWVSF